MARKRRFVDQDLERLDGNGPFRDEEEDGGGSDAESISSLLSEDYNLDDSDDEEPSASGGESQSSASAGPEAEQAAAAPDPDGWQTELQADALPEPLPPFRPARAPGVHGLGITDNPSPFDLFQMFFDERTVSTICDNTNKQARKSIELGRKFRWSDIGRAEFYKFVGLLFYMGVLSLPQVTQYWKKESFFSVVAPALVMTRNAFQAISANLHLSDPEEDAVNDAARGTPAYDPLRRLGPLHAHMKNVCKAFYHPRQSVTVTERTATAGARSVTRRDAETGPPKVGARILVLADSSNGYTVAFAVHAGRSQPKSEHRPPHEAVMSLVRGASLGTGYHLYCDGAHTSPKLFRELRARRIRACGAYTDDVPDAPTAKANALTAKSGRGTIRWIRDGPLLFAKWMDAQEVAVCSTIHTAYGGEMAKRFVRRRDGRWRGVRYPKPTPVAEHERHMGTAGLCDQAVRFYSVHRPTTRWYKIVFQHFLDIAANNSYAIHRELCQLKRQQPMSRQTFIETLAAELCGCSLDSVPGAPSRAKAREPAPMPAPPTPPAPDPAPAPATSAPSPESPGPSQFCLPAAINTNPQEGSKATEGRRHCVKCKKKTAWRCSNCRVSLCLIIDRNCFADWHESHAL